MDLRARLGRCPGVMALVLTLGGCGGSGPDDDGAAGVSDTGSDATEGDASGDHGDHGDHGGDDGGEGEGVGELRWMAGDLHLHSWHSDDALDNPVDEVIAVAEGRGLDYFVFTDHDNHVLGDITTWDDPDYRSASMLMLYGTEYTTARGHANILGVAPWDHQLLWALRDVEGDGHEITDQAHALGLHFSVNHPANDDPWEFSIDLPFDSLEVWNAVWRIPARNSEAIELWDRLLAEGRRIPGRGGSDVHHQTGFEADLLNVGNPTTWVLAAPRSPEAVLAALDQGHASISYAPGAERLLLRADGDGDGDFETIMGDLVERASAAGALTLRVDVDGFRSDAGYTLRIVQDGETLVDQALDADRFELTVPVEAGSRHYWRAELRGAVPLPLAPSPDAATLYGDLVALTNPIYLGFTP